LPFDSAADSSGAQGSGAQTEAAEAASGSALSSVLRLIARMLLGAGVALASFTATFDWEGLATRLTSDGEAKDSFAASLLAFARPAVRALYGLDPELAVSMHPVAAILLLCATSSDIGSALGKSGLLEVLSEDVERGGERALRSLETLVALCTVDAGRAKISEDAKLLGLLARLVAAGHDAVREQHAESEKKKKKKGYSTLTTRKSRRSLALCRPTTSAAPPFLLSVPCVASKSLSLTHRRRSAPALAKRARRDSKASRWRAFLNSDAVDRL
jgi:hypothetical protein